jgi:hypothetical protein
MSFLVSLGQGASHWPVLKALTTRLLISASSQLRDVLRLRNVAIAVVVDVVRLVSTDGVGCATTADVAVLHSTAVALMVVLGQSHLKSHP